LRLQGSTQRYPFSFSKLQRGEPPGTIRTWKEVERVLETANTPNKHYSVRDEIAAGGFLNKLRGIQRPLTVAKEVLANANTQDTNATPAVLGTVETLGDFVLI
jgi:hypothetical protein